MIKNIPSVTKRVGEREKRICLAYYLFFYDYCNSIRQCVTLDFNGRNMKHIFYPISLFAAIFFGACAQTGENGQSVRQNSTDEVTTIAAIPSCGEEAKAQLVQESSQSISITVKGGINPSAWKPGETATLTFNRFPRNAAQLQAVQEQYGGKPEVAVLLELMAFEIYNHDKAEGLKCLEMVNVTNNIPDVTRILKDRYNPQYGDYYTPQLVATYVEGATPENAYKANQPFTIQVRSHKVNKYQDSNALKGTVLYLEVYSSGYDTPWRGISVTKQKGCPYYKAVNCPSLYTQCKPVSFKIDDEYTDIWAQ